MSYIAARQMLTFQLGAGNVQKWFHALVPGSQIFVAEWPGELLARSLGIVEVFLRKTRDRTTPVVRQPARRELFVQLCVRVTGLGNTRALGQLSPVFSDGETADAQSHTSGCSLVTCFEKQHLAARSTKEQACDRARRTTTDDDDSVLLSHAASLYHGSARKRSMEL